MDWFLNQMRVLDLMFPWMEMLHTSLLFVAVGKRDMRGNVTL